MFYCQFFFLFIFMHNVFANPNILSKEDLDKAQLFLNPSALKKGVKEQKWVCTETGDKVFIKCDDLGINKLEGSKKELQINIRSKKYKHEYGLRHGILKRECERIENGIHKFLTQNRTVCFRGQFVSTNLARNPIIIEWVFDEVKNKNEALCEFNECD